MNEYALTEKERKWLENRGAIQFATNWYYCGFHPEALEDDYRDAAEFEERCKVKMARNPIRSKPCAYGKCSRDYETCPFFMKEGSLPFCRLFYVHIAIEKEMEEACPKN